MKKMIFLILAYFLVVAIPRSVYAPTGMKPFVIIKSEPLFKGFLHYAEDLGFRESGNDPYSINQIGCFGEYQFKESTLHYLGYADVTLRKFRQDRSVFPRERQVEALMALTDTNKVWLEPYSSYIGRTIRRVRITESGLLAACHLGGLGSVKLFLVSRGETDKSDRNGTKISDYIREFCNYRL